MNSFDQMEISPLVMQALAKNKITTPTPIQAQAIPAGIAGQDILGSAQTGTGKTWAFAIPMITRLLDGSADRALVLVPTRELAGQVQTEINKLISYTQLRTVLIIGGAPYAKQIERLYKDPEIIIGTPGRIIDHIEKQNIAPQKINFLVLDEMDRMFDMGFGIQIQHIMDALPQSRQTLMFTATLPNNIAKIASKSLRDPKRIAIGSSSAPSENIQQDVIHTSDIEKYDVLVEELNNRAGSIIIFVKTKITADRLAGQLIKSKHQAVAMHGDLRQHQRKRVIGDFRKGAKRIMVATDIATRGIDIPHIQHVINYDLPTCAEDYVHRIGRTARAGSSGYALCLIVPQDKRKWKEINHFMQSGETEPEQFRGNNKTKSSPQGRSNNKRNAPRTGNTKSFSERDVFSKPKREGFSKAASWEPKSDKFRKGTHTDEKNSSSAPYKRKSTGAKPYAAKGPKGSDTNQAKPYKPRAAKQQTTNRSDFSATRSPRRRKG